MKAQLETILIKPLVSLCLALGAGALLTLSPVPSVAADGSGAQRDPRLQWWREAKFGMFIHWGVYAVPAGEWKGRTHLAEWFQLQTNMRTTEYARFIDQFDPEKFDARSWLKVAKVAGMKYLLFTAMHHDGFYMWPTRLTDWSICRTPWWQGLELQSLTLKPAPQNSREPSS